MPRKKKQIETVEVESEWEWIKEVSEALSNISDKAHGIEQKANAEKIDDLRENYIQDIIEIINDGEEILCDALPRIIRNRDYFKTQHNKIGYEQYEIWKRYLKAFLQCHKNAQGTIIELRRQL